MAEMHSIMTTIFMPQAKCLNNLPMKKKKLFLYIKHKLMLLKADSNYSKFHDYIMKGHIEDAIATCHSKFIDILLNLKTGLTLQMEQLLENPVFKSNGMILNSESYQFHITGVLYDKVQVETDHFKSMLMANGCSSEHLKEEF